MPRQDSGRTEGRRVAALLLAALLPLIGPSFSASAQEPSFRTGSSELVVLPVAVKDKQGKFVADLTTDQFAVFDNGRRIPIELFTNEDTPVTVGLVVDASGSMRAKIGEVVASDVRRLERAMTALRPDGRTALYDGVTAALEQLVRGSRARKVLIVISDGGDNASAATLDRALKQARDSNAAIYTVGIYDEADIDRNPRVLKALAETTGGERYLPRSPGDLLRVCNQIAHEIRTGYTIGYVPPDHDGAYHRVRVVVDARPRKLTVRTRPGYFASGRTTQR